MHKIFAKKLNQKGREMKIYVASSWRNKIQQKVVKELRGMGHEVYDFKQPKKGNHGFHWEDVDPNWKNWTPREFRDSLLHPIARKGYELDFRAMEWADLCVLVEPCGRSAHLEAGYFKGAKKQLIVLMENNEPELMYNMADYIALNLTDVLAMASIMHKKKYDELIQPGA